MTNINNINLLLLAPTWFSVPLEQRGQCNMFNMAAPFTEYNEEQQTVILFLWSKGVKMSDIYWRITVQYESEESLKTGGKIQRRVDECCRCVCSRQPSTLHNVLRLRIKSISIQDKWWIGTDKAPSELSSSHGKKYIRMANM